MFLTRRTVFSLFIGEANVTRKNNGSHVSPLPADDIGAFTPSIRDAAGGAPLLGVSICPDGMGKTAQLGKNHGVFREPQYYVPRLYRTLRLRTGACWRYSSYARPVYTPSRAPADMQHVGCVLDRGSRSA